MGGGGRVSGFRNQTKKGGERQGKGLIDWKKKKKKFKVGEGEA